MSWGTSALLKKHRRTWPVICTIAGLSTGAVAVLLSWSASARLFASNHLAHLYCSLAKLSLIGAHVVGDSLIGCSYVVISGNPASLVYEARKDGSEVPVEISLSPLRREKGRFVLAPSRSRHTVERKSGVAIEF
jgi:hypothetical protein